MVNSENTMIERKKMMSRESSMPFWKTLEMRHQAQRRDSVHHPRTAQFAERINNGIPTGQDQDEAKTDRSPTIELKRHWLRVMADMTQSYRQRSSRAPAISQLPT